MIIHEKKYQIHVYEVGADGRLSPHSLFNYLQDIASEHAVMLRFGKDDLLRENKFWVLSRITALIEWWPEWSEELKVVTWPRGTDKLFAIRDFTVTSVTGRHVASASSSWLVVDRTTHRIQRPDTLLSYLNHDFPSESALGTNSQKLEPPGKDAWESSPFVVRPSELDINMHVNNVNYIRWAFDTYDPDFRVSMAPSTIEANYLMESRLNDMMLVKKQKNSENPDIVNHSIVKCSDNTEVCRVRIRWKNCNL